MMALTTMEKTPVKPIFSLVTVLLISTHDAICTTVDHGMYEFQTDQCNENRYACLYYNKIHM